MPMHIHLGRSSAFLFPRCPVRPARSCRCWARWSRPRPAASGPLRDRRRCGCRSRRSRGNRGEALVRDPTCRGGNWSFATRHRTAAESRRGAGRNQASVASLASKYPVEITVTCLWRIWRPVYKNQRCKSARAGWHCSLCGRGFPGAVSGGYCRFHLRKWRGSAADGCSERQSYGQKYRHQCHLQRRDRSAGPFCVSRASFGRLCSVF